MKKFLLPVQVLLASLPFANANATIDSAEAPRTDLQKVKFVKPSLLKMVPSIGGNNAPAIQFAQHRSHSSHGSHGSHGSHSSHYSGR